MMKLHEEAARCLLCANAKCTAACPKAFDPARAIRSVRFDNESAGALSVDRSECALCEGFCEKSCIHYDLPIRIREIVKALPESEAAPDADLSIDFLGVKCENPFFLSSSIVAGSYEMCARAFEMGWGGAVYKTIGFITPKETSPRFDAIGKEATPFMGFKNLEQISDHPLEENLEILRKLKKDYPSKVLIASIMGETDEEWRELSKLVTEVGVDMIECNFSCPQMVGEGLGCDVGQNEELVRHYTSVVKSATHLPVLAKMTPNLGNMEPVAIAAVEGGADGIAAINTVKSLTGLDLEAMEPRNAVTGKSAVSGYSGKAVKPIALRFIRDMASCKALEGVPLSGIGGIETWKDAVEFIALGCANIQITTAVMQYGYRIIDDLISGLSAFLKRNHCDSLAELVGAGLITIVSPDALDRETLVYPSFDKKRCVGCGRCMISCSDGGHQAIEMRADGKPGLIGGRCVGCHLCSLVCPVGAIAKSVRLPKKQ